MKKFHIVIVMIVVALALLLVLYVRAANTTVEIKTSEAAMNAPIHKDIWNQAGSGFELSSVRTVIEIMAPVHKDVWNKAGSGFELSSVRTTLPALAQ